MLDGNYRVNERYTGLYARLTWSKGNSFSLADFINVECIPKNISNIKCYRVFNY